ncbi:hypothetical protein LIER_38576 [Lithospermum erythrorhizon]|uniref:ATP-dependent DNA helicase n=1 Tax=Lithospermum erythrorhizon TaxID=34254 RepID=A0AAV3Q440_LITER
MTCNPNWPEIKELLHPGEEAQNRPDLLARVFKAKLSIMHDKLTSGEIFGEIASMIHVIEFQKRGLPHAHFLIILKPHSKLLTPEAYDRVVCAELMDQTIDPYFYSLVVRHMMHGPCGNLNQSNVCMKDGRCKNHYPKEFSEYTTHGTGSYPIYRRRDVKRTAKVRDIDEIATFQNARWVSRLKQLEEYLVSLCMESFQQYSNCRINQTNDEARHLNLLYKDFSKNYVWDTQMRTWTQRKRGVVIGRLSVVNPVGNERYYLRVLLSNVRCPVSYNDLLMVNEIMCKTFQEAAYKRGLLHSDDDINKTMEESSTYRMPVELRRLFATLLHYCKHSDARKLFEEYYENMAEDFKRLQMQLSLSDSDIQYKVLQGINDTLESVGRDMNEYHLVSFTYTFSDFERYTREIVAEKSIPIPEEDLHAINYLNVQQRYPFDTIFNAAMMNTGGACFVDGPGGTGKSFLYKVLLAHIRLKGYIALIVASSGIASSSFLGGRTAHSRLKIPIDGGPGVKCQISFQSGEADLIRSSRIIIWDEAPMADKKVILALDKLLQDLYENTKPFGCKLVVFCGDFPQALPVVRGGGRKEQVNASIVSSTLWKHFTKIELTDNMRARTEPAFVDFLMRIGNGEEPTNSRGEIEIPAPMIIPYTNLEQSIEALINTVYLDMRLFK